MCINLPNPHGSPQHLGRVWAGAVSASTEVFLTSLGCGLLLHLSASAWLLPELGFTLLIASEPHTPITDLHLQAKISLVTWSSSSRTPCPQGSLGVGVWL